MFIPREQQHMQQDCDHCVACRWCHTRNFTKDCFTLLDGPANHRFCDADCSAKWVQYRHMIGIAHVVRMPPHVRKEYLKGRTIDEFISDGMAVSCDHKRS